MLSLATLATDTIHRLKTASAQIDSGRGYAFRVGTDPFSGIDVRRMYPLNTHSTHLIFSRHIFLTAITLLTHSATCSTLSWMKRSHTPEGNATVPDPRPGDDDEDTALKVSERRLRLMGYPEALIKAVQDPFDYALCLRDGTTIRFEYAEPQNDEWVGLRLIREGDTQAQNDVTPNPAGCTFNRGIEVRLADIMWVADAPYGS